MSNQRAEVYGPDVEVEWPSAETKRGISSRRQELYDAMQKLESRIARASGRDRWADEVNDAVTALHTALQHHVLEIEAEDGLFVDVIRHAPHLAPEIESLRRDHEDLLVSCRMASGLIADWAAPAEIRRKVLGILGRLAIHRQQGAELLFDAYNVDLTAGD